MKPVELTGRLLARNSILNFVAQGIPLAIAIFTIPFIVRGLGTERFGLLSIVWMILGYFTIFDLGMGRAITKYVAEALGKGDRDEVPKLVWTAITIQAALGLFGTFILLGITPMLVERLLNIPIAVREEARTTFYVVALGTPLVLISASLSGVLEAAQRFDLLNIVKVPSIVSIFLLPLVGVFLHLKLPYIVGLILVAGLLALIGLLTFNLKIMPELKKFSVQLTLFSRLFFFGSWVTVSNIASFILVYADRFMIGSLLSIATVAYYTAPFEAVTRLWIIAASLTKTLFPAFSVLEGIGDRGRLEILFARSVKYSLLMLAPVVLMLVLFSGEVLQAWLGGNFATQSKGVLQILALGVMINCLASIPYTLLQGIGRPDIPAKFHLLELPIYLGMAWFLILRWGIAGAATAWTIRAALDACFLFGASIKVCSFSLRSISSNGLTLTGLVLFILSVVVYLLKTILECHSLFAQLFFFMAVFALFARIVWRNVLDTWDHQVILKSLKL